MKRFVLIDQSVTGEGGHYLSYARAVLDSAAAEAFLPVLCVNRRFDVAEELPYRIYPAFTYTSQESISTFRLRGCGTDRRSYLWGAVVKPVVQRAARIVFGTHYHEVRTRFFPSKPLQSRETEEKKYKAACFSRDFLALLSVLELCKEDIVFFPTLSIVELHGLEQALRTIDWSRLPLIHLLFRWNPFQGRREDYDEELQRMEYERERLQNCEDIHILRFHTDSERLVEQYNRFSRCRFSVLPIPHTGYQVHSVESERKEWTLSYLGDARPEKGFLYLPKVIDALSDQKVRFQIQANFNIPGGEGGVASCRRKLQRKANVTLHATALDAERYAFALAQTDIMLILYDPEQYYARTSGIFAEAMAAGIPALVPADTWMSAQVCKGRYVQLGEIVKRYGLSQTNMEVTGKEFLWKRKENPTSQIILRFTVDWDCGGDSVRVEAVMESKQNAEIGRAIDFIEKDGENNCLLLFGVPQNCNAIRFRLDGTYGQALPRIYMVKAIELSGDAPFSGGICGIFDSYDQCGAIIKSMIRHYSSIQKSTEWYSKNWSMYHNSKSFTDRLRL